MNFAAESFLERNSWAPGVVVAIVLFLFTWLFNWTLRQRDKDSKHLDFRVIDDLPILTNRPNDENLKVTYTGSEIANPRIIRVRFTNTGKQVIRDKDFLDEYVLTVDNAAIRSVSIVDETAPHLANFMINAHDPATGRITLSARTLNPSDTFTVQMIVDSKYPADVKVSGRIEGQTRTTAIQPSEKELGLANEALVFGIFVACTVGAFGIIVFLNADDMNSRARLIGLTFVLLAVTISVAGWLRAVLNRRKLFQRLQADPGEAD